MFTNYFTIFIFTILTCQIIDDFLSVTHTFTFFFFLPFTLYHIHVSSFLVLKIGVKRKILNNVDNFERIV